MLKNYLQLVRFPGIFTAFSNVLIGYFFAISNTFESLPFLLVTSGMLFSAGMIFNDFFDFKIDKKERPDRPLPSEKISRKSALYIGIIFLIIGNIISFFVGLNSLIISLLMTTIILIYNYKLKFIPFLGILSLSFIRFLNVILGFSIISFSLEAFQFAIPVGIFVCGISILARDEINSVKIKSLILNKIFNVATIGYVVILIINQFQIASIFFVSLFAFLSLNLKINKNFSSKIIQKQITLQLLSIIILDAALISIFSSYLNAILVSLFVIPAYLISRKLFLT